MDAARQCRNAAGQADGQAAGRQLSAPRSTPLDLSWQTDPGADILNRHAPERRKVCRAAGGKGLLHPFDGDRFSAIGKRGLLRHAILLPLVAGIAG